MTSPNDEPEEYILTAEEEKSILANAIQSAKDFYQYKQLELGERLDNILSKIRERNWEAEIDKESLLSRCNSNKHQKLWMEEQRRKEKELELQRLNEIKNKYTATFVFGLMSFVSKEDYGKELIVNNDTKYLITVICYFISKDERFETELGFSFKKGLLLRGAAGLGKTYLIKCIKDNELNPVSIYSMIDISETVKSEGEYSINVSKNRICYLDDVGTEEPTVNHYGTKINFFKNFIEMYYLNNKPFNQLIISTNNSFNEIEDKYGFRVRSRVKDMFNIIDVKGKDLRG